MTGEVQGSALPRPFYSDAWPRDRRDVARALWEWHLALLDADAPALDGDDLTAYFEAEAERAEARRPVRVVPAAVASLVYEGCERFGLPAELLARQVRTARRFKDPIRLEDGREVNDFLEGWARPLGRLFARLAGASGSWQLRYADELTTGFFWVGRLVHLKDEIARDWLFLPESDLEANDVTLEQLLEGRIDEGMRRLLWKQTIRAKDAFAQGEGLVQDLPRRYASAAKRWWLGGLEVLNEIERRDYDVWSEPVTLSRYHTAQVRFQARFGRTTFRSK